MEIAECSRCSNQDRLEAAQLSVGHEGAKDRREIAPALKEIPNGSCRSLSLEIVYRRQANKTKLVE